MNSTAGTLKSTGLNTTVPIFAKDLRILVRYFVQITTVLVFGSILLHVFLVDVPATGQEDFLQSFYFANLLFGPIIFALVAGSVVFAEESENGTDWFLRRLPLSRARLLAEKLGAGLVALLFVYLVSTVGAWLNPFDAPLDEIDWSATHLKAALTVVSIYLFAVAASRYTSTVVGTILVAGMFEMLMWFGYWQWERWQGGEAIAQAFLRIMIAFLVLAASLVLLTGGAWQMRLSPALWRKYPAPALVWKGIAENAALHGMAILLLVCELVHRLLVSHETPTGPDMLNENALGMHILIALIASMTVAALGTLSYTREERDGVSALLYHHPVSRTRLLLAKILAAIPGLLCLSMVFHLIAPGELETTFAHALIATGAAYSLALLLGQVLVGSIIPLFAVYPACIFVFWVLYDWLGIEGQRWWFSSTLPFPDHVGLSSVLFLMISAIGLYCLAVTWRLLTNVRFLTAGSGYRYACFWAAAGIGFIAISLLAKVLVLLY
jgi:ABC-type transport system involved in multi-copper enzyme maturation permease subunit